MLLESPEISALKLSQCSVKMGMWDLNKHSPRDIYGASSCLEAFPFLDSSSEDIYVYTYTPKSKNKCMYDPCTHCPIAF